MQAVFQPLIDLDNRDVLGYVVVTHDRELVIRAAEPLLRRLVPWRGRSGGLRPRLLGLLGRAGRTDRPGRQQEADRGAGQQQPDLQPEAGPAAWPGTRESTMVSRVAATIDMPSPATTRPGVSCQPCRSVP